MWSGLKSGYDLITTRGLAAPERYTVSGLNGNSLVIPLHTPKDEPDRINTEKVTRIAMWIYLTGWNVPNRPQRVRIDPGFKLER